MFPQFEASNHQQKSNLTNCVMLSCLTLFDVELNVFLVQNFLPYHAFPWLLDEIHELNLVFYTSKGTCMDGDNPNISFVLFKAFNRGKESDHVHKIIPGDIKYDQRMSPNCIIHDQSGFFCGGSQVFGSSRQVLLITTTFFLKYLSLFQF